ncbi:MAG TPA: alpha/beta hydrolase [Terriglobales bacterium]|nr:alpha/beta hydrolase [Terriglobales bacterium]
MTTHKVKGGGGIQIHVSETGNAKGRPILFIHGFSQCGLCWSRQMNSDLAKDFRLVAMDLRGHGLSDKPTGAYGDSKLWADDVNAVIKTLSLDHPILCGWSYGPLVILDYIRHYGEDEIGGMHFVGGISKLGSEAAMSVIASEFASLVPAFFSTDTEESVRGLEALIRMFFARPADPEVLYLMLGYGISVPVHVRKALFSRAIDNDDLLRTIRKPVLLSHAIHDTIVKVAVVDQHVAAMPHAQTDLVADTGHACFWEGASNFNRRLRDFANGLSRERTAVA